MRLQNFWRATEKDRRLRSGATAGISKSDTETVLATVPSTSQPDPTFDAVIRNLTLKKLQDVIANLDSDDQLLIRLYFFQEYTMEQIGQKFGISKMAVSKRLKKLLNRTRESMET